MRVWIKAPDGKPIDTFEPPGNVDDRFGLALEARGSEETPAAILQRVIAPRTVTVDPVYDIVAMVGDMELLAEAETVLKAIADALLRRLENQVVEREQMEFA